MVSASGYCSTTAMAPCTSISKTTHLPAARLGVTSLHSVPYQYPRPKTS